MRRRRAPERLWSPSFVAWCVAVLLVSVAGGVWIGAALSGR
jgi:hypothetical protein